MEEHSKMLDDYQSCEEEKQSGILSKLRGRSFSPKLINDEFQFKKHKDSFKRWTEKHIGRGLKGLHRNSNSERVGKNRSLQDLKIKNDLNDAK